MGRKWLSGLIIHQLLHISMVCTDEHCAVCFFDGLHSSSHTGVHSLHRLDSRVLHSRMAHHIRVGKVNDDHVILSGANGLHQLIAHRRGAHLRLKVIGGYLGGLHQDPLLSRIRLLHSAIEEEGHMGILLCLRDPGLGHMVLRQELAQGIGDGFLFKGHQLIGDGLIVIRKADVDQLQSLIPVKACERIVTERAGDLSGPVRAEVEKDHRILILDQAHRPAVFSDHRGNHELVGLSFIIGCLYSRSGAGVLLPFSPCKGPVSQLHTVPAVITVHGVIAAHDRGHLADTQFLHFSFQGFHKLPARGRRRIPSVQEAVDKHLFQAVSLSQLQKPEDMGHVAVYASVGYQSHQMKGRAILLTVLHCL